MVSIWRQESYPKTPREATCADAQKPPLRDPNPSCPFGIIPGLLLGITGWHRPGGVILGAIWAFGYLKQRGQSYGDVNWVTYPISFGGGVGLVASIWFFGSLTE